MRTMQTWALALALGVFLLVFLGALLKQPLLFAVVTSESMSPLLHRGDLAVTLPVLVHEPEEGDIAVFQPGSTTWISHRIVGGDGASGFYTKGDANPETDQVMNGYPRITFSRIKATIPEIFGRPLKVPDVGNISLSLESYSGNPYFPAVAGLLVFVMLVVGPPRRIKRVVCSRKANGDTLLLYLAVIIAVGFAAATVARSSVLPQRYDVVSTRQQMYVGNGSRGILLDQGFTQSTVLQNRSFAPLFYSVSSDLQDFSSSLEWTLLWPGQSQEVTLDMGAETLGRHSGEVRVGTFLPLLPPEVLNILVKVNYWLAVAVTSMVAALPMTLIWLLTARNRWSRITRRAPGRGFRSSLAVGR